MTKTVVFVVNHLMGAGHLARVLNLGRAFVTHDFDVHIVSGGFPVPQFDSTGMTIHQLPPIKSDGADFSRLLTLDDTLVDEVYHVARMERTHQVLRHVSPDLLIVELFPFGRRNLRREYLQLLKRLDDLRKRPKVVCSIRDILSPPSKPSKVSFAEETLGRWFDLICVHSDPSAIPLETTWPVSDDIRPMIRYTGFVAPQLNKPKSSTGHDEILVSTGSGAFADSVFHTALDVTKSDWGSKENWRLLIGRATEERLERFAAKKSNNVVVEAARPDFRDLIQNAKASISLCGYNSAMDILQSGVPAVIVPYDERSETEQSIRASALQQQPGIETVAFGALRPETLMRALRIALAAPKRMPSEYRFDGAARMVEICTNLL